MRETELYAPVKAFLEAQGYEVKAEVKDCDVVAVRDDAEPVIVELKLQLSLTLLLQGVDRQAISDHVYVCVPSGKGARWRTQIKDAVRLCRRLGLGLLSVRNGVVLAHIDPGPYAPRKFKRRRDLLLREFQNRVGDPNTGGQVKRKIITAYRQDALRIAMYLSDMGTVKPAIARDTLGIPKAASILQADHYGWFERVERGVYGLRPHGVEALETYADVVALLKA
ncbi:DUF2161 family putative PD-(D/E)XK-type phosphodiesterase [Amylibacter sp. IMCC11727]|uniref:DUF2161 family putative PD-(D/E)XK-type phosphodiesterase n=1 Tax=Amylibacter sp. IMCC11727 TaxID=3039851 RepID=UPI00244D9DD6|nr:DUF2161 family putative PD-(D/E)XK-type phosphodiesterase [Amylibacter sp. IMCC11727]WGI22649.1 DUF2161 family putative PD-(D/E)XK-type phosphodiesterase [Amylibacter sp. IMCC11727]